MTAVLRHDPSQYHLEMDHRGRVELKEFLKQAWRTHKFLKEEVLHEIVHNEGFRFLLWFSYDPDYENALTEIKSTSSLPTAPHRIPKCRLSITRLCTFQQFLVTPIG